MDSIISSTENVPQTVLSSIIQEYTKDPSAQITKGSIAAFSNSGVSRNNTFYRAEIEWMSSKNTEPAGSMSLLIKRWSPGGISLSELGWSRPIEALAWQHGILKPESLPAGVKTPIIGSVIDTDGEMAWMAMTDVSKELREFDRSALLTSEELISQTKRILSGLAKLHAYWEQPHQQEFLKSMEWLLPFGNFLWRNSAFYATLLRKDVVKGFGQAPSVRLEDSLDLNAFLDYLDPSDSTLMADLLVDRSRLVDHFAGIPYTLLHGDLDDRNIGLSWCPSGECDLVLIDWEWMGCGPAAMDVAKTLIHASMLLEPGSLCPETWWSDELPDYYYENYRDAGGSQLDYDTWRFSYDLGLIVQAIWPFPVVVGNILRSLSGEAPLPDIPGLPKEITQTLLTSGLERRRSMTELIMKVMRQYLF